MIGDLVPTARGWEMEAPTQCPNGHRLGPNRCLVGHQPCHCQGSHTTWTCRQCDTTIYYPPITPECVLLHGPAAVR